MPGGNDRPAIRFMPNDNAPEFFISGLHDVIVMPDGWVRFVPYVDRHDGTRRVYREPPYTCIMPARAIGPMIAVVLRNIPDLIIPQLSEPVRRVLLQ